MVFKSILLSFVGHPPSSNLICYVPTQADITLFVISNLSVACYNWWADILVSDVQADQTGNLAWVDESKDPQSISNVWLKIYTKDKDISTWAFGNVGCNSEKDYF